MSPTKTAVGCRSAWAMVHCPASGGTGKKHFKTQTRADHAHLRLLKVSNCSTFLHATLTCGLPPPIQAVASSSNAKFEPGLTCLTLCFLWLRTSKFLCIPAWSTKVSISIPQTGALRLKLGTPGFNQWRHLIGFSSSTLTWPSPTALAALLF